MKKISDIDLFNLVKIWDDNKGPFENLFSLLEMGGMFLSPLHIKFITLLANVLGYSITNLGKYIDDTLNLKNLDDVQDLNAFDAANKFSEKAFDMDLEEISEASLNSNLNKVAKRGFGSHSTLLGFFATIISLFKKMTVGGVGVLALQGIKSMHSDSDNKGSMDRSKDMDSDFSTKQRANTYKNKLDRKINDILK